MTQDSLCFPPPIPDDIRQRIDRAMSDPELGACAKAVLIQLVGYPATGSGRAMSIEMLRSTFAVAGIRQYSPRDIKAAVKELVEERGVPVGSRRTKPYGYFVACDAADLNDAERPLVAEIRSLAKRVRSINPKSELSRMICGQLEIAEGGEPA